MLSYLSQILPLMLFSSPSTGPRLMIGSLTTGSTTSLFPLSFQRLVHTTYHHRYTSISINGHPGSSFKVSRGVPQGDPFAPFLFNLSIEPLFNALHNGLGLCR